VDIRERVLRGGTSGLMSRIPGYAGYKQKELRREADKRLRLLLADAVAAEVRQLNSLKLDLTNRGQLLLLPELERATGKLQRFADTVRTASYGYAGLFDAVRVDEAALDALYAFDLALEGSIERLAEFRQVLAQAIERGEGVTEAIRALSNYADELNTQFGRRQETILAATPPPGPNPLDVLLPPTAMHPRAQQLINLRLQDAVTYQGVDYLVTGRIVFTGEQRPVVRYRLEGGKDQAWLWVGDGGNALALLQPVTVPEAPLGETLEVNGQRYQRTYADRPNATVEGASGRQSEAAVPVYGYRASDNGLLWIEDWSSGRQAFAGPAVAHEDLDAWTKAR
jgi:hypothetical protein